MNVVIGLVVVLASCVVGFLLSGGKLLALFQPFELLIIGGAALGAMVMSNPLGVTINVLKSGATLLKPGQKTFWGGYSGYFADPDSHLWEIAHNPFMPLDGHRRVTLPGPVA